MQPIKVIAEIGVNHNGSIRIAKQLIKESVHAGASYVKLQTYNTQLLAHQNSALATYQQTNNSWESQYQMLKSLELTHAQHHLLKQYADNQGIELISSPFDTDSLDFLIHTLNIKTIKIASSQLTDFPFLLATARSQTQAILSTGMATLGDIELALCVLAYGYLYPDRIPQHEELLEVYSTEAAMDVLKKNITLMHCVSSYPAKLNDLNLRVIPMIRETFQLPVGYSDHSLGVEAAIAAVALGASVIEKHITLDTQLPGPDHKASLPIHEFKSFVASLTNVQIALGNSRKILCKDEFELRSKVRKKLIATQHIQPGEHFNTENVNSIRASRGINSLRYFEIINRSSFKAYQPGELIEE